MFGYFSGEFHHDVFRRLNQQRQHLPLILSPFCEVPMVLVLAIFAVILPMIYCIISNVCFGWFIFSLLVLMTVGGIHMVWTHFHLLATLAIYQTGNEFALSVCAVLGLMIAVPWYAMLIFKRDEAALVNRAFLGWIKFVWVDLLGYETELCFETINKTTLALWISTFHLFDIAFHFCPPLLLLQLAAHHITIWSVVTAYCSSRLWSFVVTSHHLVFDWTYLRATGFKRLRARRLKSENINVFARGKVVMLVYGFQPHLPQVIMDSLLYLEFGVCVGLGAISLLPPSIRHSVFWVMGGGPIATTAAMIRCAAACILAGAMTSVIGSVIAGCSERD